MLYRIFETEFDFRRTVGRMKMSGKLKLGKIVRKKVGKRKEKSNRKNKNIEEKKEWLKRCNEEKERNKKEKSK